MTLTIAQSPESIREILRERVSRETMERLQRYAALIEQWQKVKNLVGPETIKSIWTRHIYDSWQLCENLPHARFWLDMGSGAGFPGIITAIVLKEKGIGCVTLVESNGRKAAFLGYVGRDLQLPIKIIAERIEAYIPALNDPIEAISARAFASLDQCVSHAEPILRKGAIGAFHIGKEETRSLASVTDFMGFPLALKPSIASKDSAIALVGNQIPLVSTKD